MLNIFAVLSANKINEIPNEKVLIFKKKKKKKILFNLKKRFKNQSN